MRKQITVLIAISMMFIASCGSSDSGDTNTTTTPTFSVTAGDGLVTISETTGTGRTNALTAGCAYNVYIASASGVTPANYSALADGAKYESVAFPYTITGLGNGTTYYLIVTEVCGGVETIALNETSATPTAGTVDISGIIPDAVNVTSVTAGVEEVTVNWGVPSDYSALTSVDFATKRYSVCYAEGAFSDDTCVQVGGEDTSRTMTGLTAGQEYCFGVKQEKNEIGVGPFGTTMCATPTDICAGNPLIAGLFTDANLQTCVDGKGWTNASDATGTLFCEDLGIVNLTGMQCLTNLTELWLTENSIVDVGPLAGLTNLTELYLDDNSIVDVSLLAGLTNLTRLGLRSNIIVDVGPLAGLTNLTRLGLDDNSIADVSPLAGLTNLTRLDLHSNIIVDVGPLAGLTNLKRLGLHNNSIVDVSPLASLTNLTLLYLQNNKITRDNDGDARNGVGSLVTLISTAIYLAGNTGMDCTELLYLIASGIDVKSPDLVTGVTCDNPPSLPGFDLPNAPDNEGVKL